MLMGNSRITLRGRQLIWVWLMSLAWLAVGLVTAADGTSGAVVGVPVAAVAAWSVVRIPCMRVTATTDAVTVHGFLGNMRYEAATVRSVSIEQTDDKLVAKVYAPVVRLMGGQAVALTQLSTYSSESRVRRGRTSRHVEALAEALGVPTDSQDG